MMKNIVIALSIFASLSSCSNSFDFQEGENIVELMKKDKRIYSLTPLDHVIWINGQKTSLKTGPNANNIYRPDFLKSIKMSQIEFDNYLDQFKKTNAYSVDFKNGKGYFIMESFLDDSQGLLYSDEDLEPTIKGTDKGIPFNEGSIYVKNKVKPYWYNAYAWH